MNRRRSSAFTTAKTKQNTKNIIILGSTKCGKTALVHRFLHNSFLDEYKPTVEDYHKKQFEFNGYRVHLEIVDMCGPFIFPVMLDINIKSAHMALLLYEINNENSLKEASNILLKINELRNSENPLHIIFIGTKLDLHGRDNEENTMSNVNECLNIDVTERNHILTSSKANINVTEAFHLAMEYIVTHFSLSDYKRAQSEGRNCSQQ